MAARLRYISIYRYGSDWEKGRIMPRIRRKSSLVFGTKGRVGQHYAAGTSTVGGLGDKPVTKRCICWNLEVCLRRLGVGYFCDWRGGAPLSLVGHQGPTESVRTHMGASRVA